MVLMFNVLSGHSCQNGSPTKTTELTRQMCGRSDFSSMWASFWVAQHKCRGLTFKLKIVQCRQHPSPEECPCPGCRETKTAGPNGAKLST